MIVSLEKPGTPSELVHFGIKGMKWGVRKERTPAEQVKYAHRKQVAKKVAIGVSVAALVVGTAYVGYRLKKSGKLPISSLRRGGTGKGKVFKNIDEAIAAKNKAQGVLKSHGSSQIPDPKLLKEHQETLKHLRNQADWSVDWNAIFKQTHGVSASEHKTSLVKFRS